jgi:hypothetical protein
MNNSLYEDDWDYAVPATQSSNRMYPTTTQQSFKPQLPIVNFKKVIPVVITKEVLNKIKFLCAKIPEVEWSGVIFYKLVGGIKSKSPKIIPVDILPMDKGTKAYTNFEMDNRLVEYFVENPEAYDLHIGLVH